jgi:hypothetical protein
VGKDVKLVFMIDTQQAISKTFWTPKSRINGPEFTANHSADEIKELSFVSFSVLCLSAVSFLGASFPGLAVPDGRSGSCFRRRSGSSFRRARGLAHAFAAPHAFAGGLAQALAACFLPLSFAGGLKPSQSCLK